MMELEKIKIIAFDADDTLWHNESLFTETQTKFKALLSVYHSDEWIEQKLIETERRNLNHFGYGIKGFTLSMIETAIELTEGRISGREISGIIGFSRGMLSAPVELLEGVDRAIKKLSETHELMIITKGDLFDQESKIARSGLGDFFSRVEILKEKDEAAYQKILAKHAIPPDQFLMVGNSLKSDILPVLANGGAAVHIPYHTTVFFERVDASELDGKHFIKLEKISELEGLFAG